MAQMTSGKVLRETRERKGYDLNTVARRLRIRPDILKAIEAGDFSAMPPRGYTRNMVNAYARLLGLNPTEIVNMYLDEAYANQVEKARGSAPSSGFHMERETRRSRTRIGVGSGAVEDEPDETGLTQYARRLYDDSTRYARDDYGVTRKGTNKAGKSERDFSSHHSGYSATSFKFIDENRGVKRGNKHIYAGQTGMQYTPSRMPAFLQSRGIIIAIIAIIVIIIIALVVILGGNKGTEEQTASTVNGMPNTGTTTSEESSEASEPAPTSERVVYKVPQGSTCYVVTINDGKRSEEELASMAERTVDVTGTFIIGTFTPDALEVTVDGEKVELKQDQEYDGLYVYKVDFAAYLEKWRSTHSSRDAQRQAAVAEAGITSPSSSSASASSADGASDANLTGQSTDESAYYTEQTADNGYYYDDSGYTDYGYGYDSGYGYDYGYDYGYGDAAGYTGYGDATGYYTDTTGYGGYDYGYGQ